MIALMIFFLLQG